MSLKIWERYFLVEFLTAFALFLGCFYGLYVLIDYSSNAGSFLHHHVQFQWKVTILYYLCELAKRIEVLLPFALLVATIRTLCNLNIHNELIALMSGGLSLKTLMRPFIYIGIFSTALIYLNTQFFLPTALSELKHIDANRSREKHKHQQNAAAQHLALADNSTLVFHNYDAVQNLFFDAYWVKSIDDIYRIKYLYPNSASTNIPTGKFVERLQRNRKGELIRTDALVAQAFPNMHFNKKTLFETITPASEQSITALWRKLPEQHAELSERDAQTLTSFYYKLAMPWLCLLAILAPAPSCLRCTRQLPIFFIYACSIFGLVALYLIMDAAAVLGERHVVTPAMAIWVPFGLVSAFVTTRFLRKC